MINLAWIVCLFHLWGEDTVSMERCNIAKTADYAMCMSLWPHCRGKTTKIEKKKSLWGKINEIQGKHQEKSDNDEMPMHDIFLF